MVIGIWKEKTLSMQIALTRDEETVSFTFVHLADSFIQSDLQCIQAIHERFKTYIAYPPVFYIQ